MRPPAEDLALIVEHNDDHAETIENDPDTPEAYTPGCYICNELWELRDKGPADFCLVNSQGRICTRPKDHTGRHMAVNSERYVVYAWTTH